jgi:predicted outer membrane lipoprotein
VRVVSDFIAGVLAVLVGLVFCYQGYLALRIAIAVWGGFVGFALGASIGRDDQGILGTAFSWILGLVLALVFAGLAYLYYEVSIALAMGSIGFVLGTSLLVALGVTWSWVIVLSGLALGIALAFVAIAGDLPTVLLIVLSAMAGASVIVAGVMLLTGALGSDDITRSAQITDELHDDWYWYPMYIALAISGVVVQLRASARRAATMREAWAQPTQTAPAA